MFNNVFHTYNEPEETRMSKADFLPSWSIRQPLVHTYLGDVLGYKALKAKQSRQPVKDFERKLDQTWKLTCSFLESSDM